MKFKFSLLALLSLCFCSWATVGCSDDDNEPVIPEEKAPVVTPTPKSLECDAMGGDFKFTFEVANATDAQAEAHTKTAWITDMKITQTTRATIDGAVEFKVMSNESQEARRGEITLTYAGENVVFEVNQAGADAKPEKEPEPEKELTLDITVAAGDEMGENKTSMLTFTVKSKTATGLDFACIAKRDVDNLLSAGMTENDIIEMRYNSLDPEYIEQMHQEAGFALQIGPLTDDTEYSLLARAKGEGDQVLIKRCEGKTEVAPKPGENLNAPFKIKVGTEVIPGGFLMTLTPNDASMQYVCHIALKGAIERLTTDEELVNFYMEQLGSSISDLTFTGEISTKAEQFKGAGSYLPGAEYYVIAFGFDGTKATTPVLRKLVKAGEGPAMDGLQLKVAISEITAYGARATIETNRDCVPFVFDIMDRFGYEGLVEELKAEGMTEGEIIKTYFDDLFTFQQANYQATPEEVIESFGGWYSGAGYSFEGDLYPEAEFVVFAAACDITGKVSSEIYSVSEPFTTLAEGGVASVAHSMKRPLFSKRGIREFRQLMQR